MNSRCGAGVGSCFVHSPNASVREGLRNLVYRIRMPGLGVGGARLLAESLDLGRLARRESLLTR